MRYCKAIHLGLERGVERGNDVSAAEDKRGRPADPAFLLSGRPERSRRSPFGNNHRMAKGDFVEVVRTAKFMAPRVLAVVEHPAGEETSRDSARRAA